jgi:hypothetical protein
LTAAGGGRLVYGLAGSDWYERHAAAAPSATQLDNFLTRRAVVVPTNCDCARARAKLTVCQPLAVERVGYEQWPVIRHWIHPTIGRDLVAMGVMCDRTDKRSEPLRTSHP